MSKWTLLFVSLLLCASVSVLVWGGMRAEPGWWPENSAAQTHAIVGTVDTLTPHKVPRPWTVEELRRGVQLRRQLRAALSPWMPSMTAIMVVLTGLVAASAISGDLPWPD